MAAVGASHRLHTGDNPLNLLSEAVPKDEVTEQTPPPAYTPSRLSSISALAAQELHRRNLHTALANSFSRPLETALIDGRATNGNEDEDRASGDESGSPISLRINTSVNVNKNNNIVFLEETPANHANAIAKAVVHAMQQSSAGQCGIPMIDEEGRPRPIRIEVDASMVVDGTGNVIGSRGAVSELLASRQRVMEARKRRATESDGEPDSAPAKRHRAEAPIRRRASFGPN